MTAKVDAVLKALEGIWVQWAQRLSEVWREHWP